MNVLFHLCVLAWASTAAPEPPRPPEIPAGAIAEDLDFDGHADYRAPAICGATGNCTYDVWLYAPKKKRYVATDAFAEITEPRPNKKTRDPKPPHEWGRRDFLCRNILSMEARQAGRGSTHRAPQTRRAIS
jgi:hypothetical protein